MHARHTVWILVTLRKWKIPVIRSWFNRFLELPFGLVKWMTIPSSLIMFTCKGQVIGTLITDGKFLFSSYMTQLITCDGHRLHYALLPYIKNENEIDLTLSMHKRSKVNVLQATCYMWQPLELIKIYLFNSRNWVHSKLLEGVLEFLIICSSCSVNYLLFSSGCAL